MTTATSARFGGASGRTVIFLVAGVAAITLAFPAALWLARSPSEAGLYEQLATEIGCQCGTCPMRPIGTCGCGYADRMLGELRGAVDSGQDPDAIMATFVANYGSAVRIKPSGHGFDLLAWTAPVVLLLVGGVMVAAVITKWRQDGAAHHAMTSSAGARLAATDGADRRSDEIAERPGTAGREGGTVEPPAGEADDEERRCLEIVERELDELPE